MWVLTGAGARVPVAPENFQSKRVDSGISPEEGEIPVRKHSGPEKFMLCCASEKLCFKPHS
jgi:hypothetical protein